MKKINLLFLSLLSLATITSCSNDDDNSSASIEAKWELYQEGETLSTLETINNSCGLEVLEIKSGGTFKITGYYSSDVTINAAKNVAENKSTCHEYTEEGTWSKKDNKLTVKNGDDINEFEIIELTDSSLKLKETDEEGIWYIIFRKK